MSGKMLAPAVCEGRRPLDRELPYAVVSGIAGCLHVRRELCLCLPRQLMTMRNEAVACFPLGDALRAKPL